MKRIFSFSLGNIAAWSTSKNRNDLIGFAKQLDVTGVEITLPTSNDLYLFELSEDNRSWLLSLEYVTIHAPFRLLSDTRNDMLTQIDRISMIYDDVNAKNVVIHPATSPLALEILEICPFHVSLENLPPKSRISSSDIKRLMDEHPHLKLCIDVSHAYLWSKSETGILTENFQNRISQIHLSGTYRKKDHQSLRSVSSDFLLSIAPIKELDVPMVVEENMTAGSLAYVKKELEFVGTLFG